MSSRVLDALGLEGERKKEFSMTKMCMSCFVHSKRREDGDLTMEALRWPASRSVRENQREPLWDA